MFHYVFFYCCSSVRCCCFKLSFRCHCFFTQQVVSSKKRYIKRAAHLTEYCSFTNIHTSTTLTHCYSIHYTQRIQSWPKCKRRVRELNLLWCLTIEYTSHIHACTQRTNTRINHNQTPYFTSIAR